MMMTGIQNNQAEYLKPKIMIVEDEAVSASLLKNTVERYEYTVCCVANSGEEALEMAEMYQPDLILMDIVLAGQIDGIDAAKQIRSRLGIPIVFTTGYDDQARLDRAKLLTPVSYIMKPYNDRQIRVTIEMALYVGNVEKKRRQAEKSSRESDERLRFAMETTRIGVWDLDLTDHTAFRSIEHDRIFGYADLLPVWTYETFLEHVLPEDLTTVDSKFRRAIETKTDWNFECRIRRTDGEVRWIWAAGRHQLEVTGEVRRMAGIILDVTERRMAEEALLESENKFENFAEQALAGIYLIQDGVFKYVNPKFAKLFGYTVEECLNDLPFKHLVYKEDVRNVQEQVRRRTSGEVEFVHYTFRGLKKNGEIFHVETYGSGTVYKGKPAAIGTILDITERKRTEEALRESEERFDLAIHSALMGVWTWDITNDRRYFDDQVCLLLGITPETFTGTQEEFFRRVHPDDHNAVKTAMARTLAQDVMYEPEYRVVWPDGSIHYITSRARLIRDDAGKPMRLNGILWDVTAQKKAEEERQKLETQLRQAQKMEAIGTLAGGIAHDFNNILGSIIGYAELALIDAPPESDLKDCLDQIYKGGKRAADLVKHILAFSRQSEQLKKPLRIGPIVKECLKLLRASLPSTIEIVQHISAGDRTTLADPTQIHQIIMNLGTNAMQAMQEKGGCLTVKLEQVELTSNDSISDWELETGPYLRLTVSDTGKGIQPEIIDRIFEPYFTTKDIGEGTGLGLSVIYGIVQSHNGAVTVSSEPGMGTEFSIYLPQTRKNIDADEDITIEYVTGTGKILLVDDEEALVNSGQLVLERLGYEVRPYT
ncbi:MAG: PAS domain S-box protein, partial [Deltaproteobacteria bacterium]|nr:PAS domain S-box protein [Deltaproteobacteria bacterium]